MSGHPPRIALISATPAAIPPAVEALAAEFPEAEPWNLLDDRLLSDAERAGGLTAALSERMSRFIDHAVAAGADAVLLTCSMYGPVARAHRARIPVLAPDEAAFDELVDHPGGTAVVVASLEPALDDALQRLQRHLAGAGRAKRLVGALARGAFGVADPEVMADRLEEAVRPNLDGADVVVLAQYSLAPSAAALAERVGRPVISGPLSAAIRLREALERG